MNVSFLGKPVWPKDEENRVPETLIPNFKIKKIVPLEDIFERIKSDEKLKAFTEAVKRGEKKKHEAEGFICGGEFTYRKNDVKNWLAMSGVILIDIDKSKDKETQKAIDNGEELPLNAREEFKYLFDELKKWKYTYAVHHSFTPGNLSLYIKIPRLKERYQDYFRAINNELFEKFHVVADTGSMNPAFAKRISYDANIFVNEKATEWTKLPKKEPQKFNQFNPEISADNFGYCINQIRNNGVDICYQYDDWVAVMLGIADYTGVSGLDAFMVVTEQHTELKQSLKSVERKYMQAVRASNLTTGKRWTIKSFFWLCQKAGINIVSDHARLIRAECLKQFGNKKNSLTRKTEEVLKGLAKKNVHVPKEDDKKLTFLSRIDRFLDMDAQSFGELVKTGNNQVDINNYLRGFNPCMNMLNREIMVNGEYDAEAQIYLGGEILEERDLNSLYSDCNELFDLGQSQSFGKLFMNSSKIPQFHPFESFLIRKKREVTEATTGHIDKVLEAIKIKTHDAAMENFLKYLLRKWMLALMQFKQLEKNSSLPVFTGEGFKNKTRWFRYLLPEELRKDYFVQSSFEKSDNMNRYKADRLIIMDDEFKASTIKEVKNQKELTSENFVTHRPLWVEKPITFARSPIYCATTNDKEIINDDTGNRRVIPIPIKDIDFEMFDSVDKDLLFLELEKEYLEKGENCFFMTEDDVANLKKYSDWAINKNPLEVLLEACTVSLIEGSKKGTVITKAANRIRSVSRIRFDTRQFNLALKNLGIIVDKDQSGEILAGKMGNGIDRWLPAKGGNRKTIMRVEFLDEYAVLNGQWKQP